MYKLYIAFGIWLCIALLAALAKPSKAQEIHSWTDQYGTIHFVDDSKRIPTAYRDQAKTVEPSDSRRTVVILSDSEVQADLNRRLDRLRAINGLVTESEEVPACTEPLTITSHRVHKTDPDTGLGHSERYYMTIDGCGRLIAVTPVYPDIQAIQ